MRLLCVSVLSRAFAALLPALALVPPAFAATFTVTNLNDSGAGSLRQAIEDSNAAAGADVIAFHPAVTGTIALSDILNVTDSVDIQGPGSDSLTIVGLNYWRAISFAPFPTAGHEYSISGITFSNSGISGEGDSLTLTDVTVTGAKIGGPGGAVYFSGAELTIEDSTITESVADNGTVGGGCWEIGPEGGDGGGVYVQNAVNVTLRNVTVSDNVARYSGGGVWILLVSDPATVLIENSRFTGNTAGHSPECMPGSGGGVAVIGSNNDDAVTVTDSVFSGNTAGGGSGGGLVLADIDTATIARSTFSGNQAAGGDGGGISVGVETGTIENVTISGNTAALLGGALATQPHGAAEHPPTNLTLRHTTISGNGGGTSGGIHAVADATITIANSIVANSVNTTTNTSGPDLHNDATSSFAVSYANVEDAGTAAVTDGGGNLFATDPQLGVLQNNGSATLTHLPADTSPVVNAGDPAFAPPPSTDQRGLDRVIGGRLDMGSVEVANVSAGTLSLSAATYAVAENGGSVTITVTRTDGSAGAVSVQYATSDGSAGEAADYAAASGTLTWAGGDTSAKTFTVSVTDDAVYEDDETVTIALSDFTGGASVGTSSATLTIDEDEAFPTLTVSNVSASEGHSGTTAFQFTVTLAPASASTVNVNFETAAGTAQASDFLAAAGPLTFAPGVTAQVVNVSVVGDTAGEVNETFSVVLSSATNANAGGPGTGTIVNDDPPPTPLSVVASATSSTAISIGWAAAPSAATYEIEKQTSAGSAFVPLGTTSSTSFSDSGLTANTAYRYRVRAVNAFGVSGYSAPDFGTTVVFTNPVLPGAIVRGAHVSELRAAANAVRAFAGLAAATFTGTAAAGTIIQAVHITELRAAVDAARSALGLPTGGYTDTTLTGVRVKGVHLQQLRDRL